MLYTILMTIQRKKTRVESGEREGGWKEGKDKRRKKDKEGKKKETEIRGRKVTVMIERSVP